MFVANGMLLHAGRGRMPIFTRDDRTLAAFWNDVHLPADMATEDGPDPKYSFVRGVAVSDLRDYVTRNATIGSTVMARRAGK